MQVNTINMPLSERRPYTGNANARRRAKNYSTVLDNLCSNSSKEVSLRRLYSPRSDQETAMQAETVD